MCFWICWLCIRTSMETPLQVLAFIIFHRDKTKQQRDGREEARECWGGGGSGACGCRRLSGTGLTLPKRQRVSKWSHILISNVSCLLKSLTPLATPPWLLLPSLWLSVFLYSLIFELSDYTHRYLGLNTSVWGEGAALALLQLSVLAVLYMFIVISLYDYGIPNSPFCLSTVFIKTDCERVWPSPWMFCTPAVWPWLWQMGIEASHQGIMSDGATLIPGKLSSSVKASTGRLHFLSLPVLLCFLPWCLMVKTEKKIFNMVPIRLPLFSLRRSHAAFLLPLFRGS